MEASLPVGCQSNSDGGKAHGYDERKEIRFLGCLEGLPMSLFDWVFVRRGLTPTE